MCPVRPSERALGRREGQKDVVWVVFVLYTQNAWKYVAAKKYIVELFLLTLVTS